MARPTVAVLVAGFIVVVLPLTAVAQERYPTRPIKMVVALGAGSATDALARIVAEFLRQELGTDVVVENKAGAGGVVGGDYVAKSKPDGYTLGALHSSVVTTSPALSSNYPFDPLKDIEPLGSAGVNPIALVVNAASPWKTLEAFLEQGRKGKVTCGIIGVGSHSHFNLELLKSGSGAQIAIVPYKEGTGPAIAALLGAHIDCSSLVWPAVAGHVRGGKFSALAVTSRLKDAPDLPTFAKKGFPQLSLEVFLGFYGPAGLPKEVVAKLLPAFEKAIKNPENAVRLEKTGFSVAYEGPKEVAERIRREMGIAREVAKKSGITQD